MDSLEHARKQCAALISNQDKWVVSLLAGLLFLILSAPASYRLTHRAGQVVGLDVAARGNGGPTLAGLVLHALVFALVVRLLLR